VTKFGHEIASSPVQPSPTPNEAEERRTTAEKCERNAPGSQGSKPAYFPSFFFFRMKKIGAAMKMRRTRMTTMIYQRKLFLFTKNREKSACSLRSFSRMDLYDSPLKESSLICSFFCSFFQFSVFPVFFHFPFLGKLKWATNWSFYPQGVRS